MNLRIFGMDKLSADETEKIAPYLTGRTVYSYNVDTDDFKGSGSVSPFVCILVSDRTASSADYFVSAVKSFENTVVIGENTGGEKTGGQFLAMLPKSRLVYYYNASVILNDDGSDNSLYGTEPDIRCRLSVDGYRKRYSMLKENRHPEIPERRLEWDDVLAKAFEVCKK